jgi:hypothetical protein
LTATRKNVSVRSGQSLFHSLDDVRLDFAVSEHESAVRYRTDLIDQQIGVVFQILRFLDPYTQRKRVSRGRRFRLTGAGDDDGCGMPRFVEGIGV